MTGLPYGHRKRQPVGEDVFHWPEFQALVKRLGVPDAPISSIAISLSGVKDPVVVSVVFEAADATGKTVADPPPPMTFPNPHTDPGKR